LNEAAQGTGLPVGVVTAQANEESGQNPDATSPAGAEGFWQFLPSTFNGVAAQAGVPDGTEYNVADETKAYIVYMNQLLQEEHGSIQDALAAYNAGPGDIGAGMGYANTILANAGTAATATSSGGAGVPASAATTSYPGGAADPLNWPSTVSGTILKALGITPSSIEDLLERFALMLFGSILIIVGILRMTDRKSGDSKQQNSQQVTEQPAESEVAEAEPEAEAVAV
jgi:hypothetical protein